MNKAEIVGKVKAVLERIPEVMTAYVHGSFLTSEQPRDLDIAICLEESEYRHLYDEGRASMDFSIPLEIKLEQGLGIKCDVQLLNAAPLSFRYRAIASGRVVLCKDEGAREIFECMTRVEYFDFHPRRKEYLAEALA